MATFCTVSSEVTDLGTGRRLEGRTAMSGGGGLSAGPSCLLSVEAIEEDEGWNDFFKSGDLFVSGECFLSGDFLAHEGDDVLALKA